MTAFRSASGVSTESRISDAHSYLSNGNQHGQRPVPLPSDPALAGFFCGLSVPRGRSQLPCLGQRAERSSSCRTADGRRGKCSGRGLADGVWSCLLLGNRTGGAFCFRGKQGQTTFSCFSDRSLSLNLCLAISAGLFNVCKQIINRRVAEQATSFRCIVSMPCLGLLQKSNHANEPHVLTKNSYPCYSDLFLRHRLLIHLHTVACNQVRGFSMLTFIIASWRFAARTSLSSVDKKTSASALSAQAICGAS